jgi:IS5 family transposase
MALANQVVPAYSSKFSKKRFTQAQHVALNCLRIKLKVTYRDLVDWLGEMPRIQEALGLKGKELPHWTTVQKAFDRLSLVVWRVLLRTSAALRRRSGIAGIDASGFDRHYASRYYTQRSKLKISSIKTTLLVDVGAQVVLDLHLTTGRKHDTQIGPQVAGRSRDEFDILLGDKGYDDRSFRKMLRKIGVRPLIKHREYKPYDKAANARMDEELYHKRSLAETVNSVIKRKYGDSVSSRVWYRQFREIVAKCVVHNVERAVKTAIYVILVLGPILALRRRSQEDFYKATIL